MNKNGDGRRSRTNARSVLGILNVLDLGDVIQQKVIVEEEYIRP